MPFPTDNIGHKTAVIYTGQAAVFAPLHYARLGYSLRFKAGLSRLLLRVLIHRFFCSLAFRILKGRCDDARKRLTPLSEKTGGSTKSRVKLTRLLYSLPQEVLDRIVVVSFRMLRSTPCVYHIVDTLNRCDTTVTGGYSTRGSSRDDVRAKS